MEPRIVLIKPAHLPALPEYGRMLRNVRVMTIYLAVLPVALAAILVYADLKPLLIIGSLVAISPSVVILIRGFAKSRARLAAIMAGEAPVVSAVEVEGGYALRPSHRSARSGGLPVCVGDTVSVVVEQARDPRKGGNVLGLVSWRFTNGDATPLTVLTYFDADPALLRDVEGRLKTLGVTAEISHRPFAETRGN